MRWSLEDIGLILLNIVLILGIILIPVLIVYGFIDSREIRKQKHISDCNDYIECSKKESSETCVKWIDLDIRTCEGILE